MLRVFMRRLRDIKKWRIHIGRNPEKVDAPAVILFPLWKTVLFCGLAGIVAIKGTPRKIRDRSKALAEWFAEAIQGDLQTILSGGTLPDAYLGGRAVLGGMEKEIMRLKCEKPFEQLFFDAQEAEGLSTLADRMNRFIAREEKILEDGAGGLSSAQMESINARLIVLKDVAWGLQKDVLENIGRIKSLAGVDDVAAMKPAAFEKYSKINFLLNALDRLEVRGRDSAGVQLSLTLKDGKAFHKIIDHLKKKDLYDEFLSRTRPGDLIDGSIQLMEESPAEKPVAKGGRALAFTYKTFSIIGELGLNARNLRISITADRILRAFAEQEAVFETSFAHTRWASVGSITEENCHPVNNFTLGGNGSVKDYLRYGKGAWTISCALNGDIDNYDALRRALEPGYDFITPELTTDTKIIPLQIEKHLFEGHDMAEAFRLAVSAFEGSHAIAMVSNAEPGKVFLALRGSGQTIYVGIAPDRYIFSSEIYGLVEGTSRFIKMDGETPSSSDVTGQIFVLDQASAGGIDGIRACYYDGTSLNLDESHIKTAEITTRDIDRGAYPHFFLKEVTESTASIRKTLRGKYRIVESEDGRKDVTFNLGTDCVPESIQTALKTGAIHQIYVIGHGTAAVAASAVADAMGRCLAGSSIAVEAKIASELSGFFMTEDLRNTLIIPITQSGTTTDTNRAVAMAVERGAPSIAVVNRRQSDITTKTQGVFYTSDGRDIEMSVASTKAFYSQIIAGHVLALYFAQLLKTLPDEAIARELTTLERVPAMMNRVLEKKDRIRESVDRVAKQKKYWAVVGSGPNKVAADEIRIKLSELCYKTISSDVVENKKHIDLSAEPLIIVCAGGTRESVVGDIIKDTAIFKAHKASVVVFADEDERRFDRIADTVIGLPKSSAALSVILNTLAGHLWGYYAACSIDEDAWFYREFRTRLDLAIREQNRQNYSLYDRLFDSHFRRVVGEFAGTFNQRRNEGAFTFMNSKTISDIVLLLKYVVGKLPLEDFWHDFKVKEGFASPIDLLDVTLGQAIDELSRPIDAIKHQAKTVTVGTSRKELPPKGVIFDLLAALSFASKALTGDTIVSIGRVQKAVAAVNGYTLYDIHDLDEEGKPTDASVISAREKGGIAAGMKSRADVPGVLMGTKKTIVRTGDVYIGKGKSDGASIVIVPILGESREVRNLLLLHVAFNDVLTLSEKKDIMGDRFNDIRDMINEYNLTWQDQYLENVSLEVLLSDPVDVAAEKIKNALTGNQRMN